MNQKMKIILSIMMVMIIITAGYAYSAEKAKETFKIGVVTPLTGQVGWVGVGMQNAMFLAKEQLKDTKYNYEIRFEDSQFDPKYDASGAQKLINVDKVDAIVSIGFGGPIITPLAKEHNIVHFSISVQTYIADGVNSFLHWAPSKKLNALLVKEMQHKGIKKVAVFRTTSMEAWEIYMQDFQKLTKGTDIKVVSDHTFLDSDKDFRSMIAEARAANPDIYLFYCQTPAMEILTKQMKEAGITTPLTSVESFEATEEGNLYEGYWYVSAIKASKAFTDAFNDKYHYKPPICSPNAYDIVNLIVRAVENVDSKNKPTTKQIVAELKKIKDFPGALGNLSISDDGIVMSGVQLKMIKNNDHIALSDPE